jgi:glutaryl-CoA dehydrogenase
MNKFTGVDYFNVESLLQQDEIMVRNTVREFVDDRVVPVIEKYYHEEKFPAHLIAELANLNLLGSTLPQKYGCAEMNNVAYGLVMQELERGDSGIRSFVSVQSSLVMYPIFTFGREEQKNYWLPKLACGEKIGCFGLTEPDFGSNPGGMITRAEKIKDGYKINGAKMWITNGTIADIAIVWAKLDGG